MAKASFAAGIGIPRGLPAAEGTLRQAELLTSHVVVAFVLWFSELASGVDPSGLLVCSGASSLLLLPLSAIMAAAPIPIPNSTEKNAVRSSRRSRGVGDKKPNSG